MTVYLDYWSLQRAPFDAVPDSRLLFPTPQHERVLATISYAVREAGEPVLITGPVGCGKTLLLRTLRRQLPPGEFHVAFVPDVAGGRVGLLCRVAYHLMHTVAGDTAGAMDIIAGAVAEAEQHKRPIVVMFDDWPAAATPDDFEELRWLLNLDVESTRVCALLTSESTGPMAQWPEWLRQRLFTSVSIGPLAAAQVQPYLEHRLRCAGHPEGALFGAPAAAAIAEWSRGIPRLVNRLAHLALQVGCLQLVKTIGEDTVRMAVERLGDLASVDASEPLLHEVRA